MKRLLLVATIAVLVRAFAVAGETLTARDIQAFTVSPASESPSVVFTADPSPAGGDIVDVACSDGAAIVSLVLPSGVEVTAANAESLGFTYGVVPPGGWQSAYVPSPLVSSGTHTVIVFGSGAVPGGYSVKIDNSKLAGDVPVYVTYYSSSALRAGLFAGQARYQVGGFVPLTGIVYDGSTPVQGAEARLRIADRQNLAKPPIEVPASNPTAVRQAIGDNAYLWLWQPEKAGIYTAVMQVKGSSPAGVAFSRTATTEVRVSPKLASLESLRDSGVDTNGDGIVDGVALTARLKVTQPGTYQLLGTLVTSLGETLSRAVSARLEQGDRELSLWFDRAEMTALGENGPYDRRNVALVYDDDAERPALAARESAGPSCAYDLRAFNGTRLTGVGIDPARLEFGTVAVGASKELMVTIRNANPLAFTESMVGSLSAPFSTSIQAPFTVPAQGELRIPISFKPTVTGFRTASLAIAGMTVAISGEGGPAASSGTLTPSSTDIDFGDVTVAASKESTFTIRNTGSAGVAVPALAVTGSSTFSIVSPTGTFAIAAGGTQTVTVRFSPRETGTQTARIGVGSAFVTLTGNGVSSAGGATIDLSTASLDFGAVTVNQTKDLVLTVRNTGTGALTITTVTSSNPVFTVTPAASNFSLAAGATRSLTVRFSPTTAGQQSGTLRIDSSDAARPQASVSLMGLGQSAPATGSAQISVAPTRLEFGNVLVGSPKDLSLEISGSSGTASLALNSISVDNPRFSVTSIPLPVTLGFGAKTTVTVRFSPVGEGPQSGALTIESNAVNQPRLAVPLTATGVASGEMELKVDDGTFEGFLRSPVQSAELIHVVNRLTPPAYPATVSKLRVYLPETTIPGSFGLMIGSIASNATLDRIVLRGVAAQVRNTGAFIEFDVPSLAIDSGDFVVGFYTANTDDAIKVAVDTNSASAGRSYIGNDGYSFRPVNGNIGIRAVVSLGR